METKYSNPGPMAGEAVWMIENQFTALPGNKDLYLKSVNYREKYVGKYVFFSINQNSTDEIVGHAIATIMDKTVSVEFKLYEEEISMVCKMKDIY